MTKLKAITDFVKKKRIKSMKKWSDRYFGLRNGKKCEYIRKISKEIKMLFDLLSGYDPLEMIKSLYTEKQIETIMPQKYKSVLTNLSEYYKEIDFKQRHKFIRNLKLANFKYCEARKFGFEVSRQLWKTCLNDYERDKGGGREIPADMKYSINSYLKQNSNILADRMVKIKEKSSPTKIFKPARILTNSKIELYKSFPYKISRSTFYKYIKLNQVFKKSQRLTDLCSYCEDGLRLKKKLANIFKNEEIEWDNVFNIKKLIQRQEVICLDLQKQIEDMERFGGSSDQNIDNLSESFIQNRRILINLKDFEVICFHKNIARVQRIAYNNHRKNVDELKDKLLIEIDFKQKIIIGMGPRQVSNEFYEQTQRSCLGFGIYHLSSDNSIRKINFDIITHDLSQDGQAAVRGFRFLREQEFFKSIETKNYNVWADVGPHFRNHVFVGYLLKELKEQKIHVNLNYFVDKHGKNTRDSHFSNVSRFINQQSLLTELKTSEDIVKAIITGTKKANENKKDETITFAAVLDDEVDRSLSERFPNYKTLEIQNICSYYNYRTHGKDFKLVTSILSNDNSYIPLVLKNNKEETEQYRVIDKETLEKVENVTYTTWANKKMRIMSAISQINQSLNPHSLNINNDINQGKPNEISLENPSISSSHSFVQTNEATQNVPKKNGSNIQPLRQMFHDELKNDYYRYFSMEPDEEEIVVNKVTPPFCRDKNTKRIGQKPLCLNCTAPCRYTLKMLMDTTTSLGQELILNELMEHSHPSSRKMPNGEQRTTNEASEELINHYIYAHNKKRPVIIDLGIQPIVVEKQPKKNKKKIKQ